jgi:hypothetical protein
MIWSIYEEAKSNINNNKYCFNQILFDVINLLRGIVDSTLIIESITKKLQKTKRWIMID